jgi:hypothetical protein
MRTEYLVYAALDHAFRKPLAIEPDSATGF